MDSKIDSKTALKLEIRLKVHELDNLLTSHIDLDLCDSSPPQCTAEGPLPCWHWWGLLRTPEDSWRRYRGDLLLTSREEPVAGTTH